MRHSQASDWEVEAAVHLLDAFHTVKGPPLEELAQVCLATSPPFRQPCWARQRHKLSCTLVLVGGARTTTAGCNAESESRDRCRPRSLDPLRRHCVTIAMQQRGPDQWGALQERKRRHAERGDLVVDAAAPIPESRPESGADDGSDDSASDSGSDRRRCAPTGVLAGNT